MVPTIEGRLAEGRFDPNIGGKPILEIARDLSRPNLSEDHRQQIIDGVTGHELIHAMRHADMLKRNEWQRLSRKANEMKVPEKKYTFLEWAAARNPSLKYASQIQEEAVAEMAKHFQRNPEAFKPKERGPLGRIVERIRNFIRGLTDGEAVLSDIFEGRLADRQEGEGQLGKPYNEVNDQVAYSQPEVKYSEASYDPNAPLGQRVPNGVPQDTLSDIEAGTYHEALGPIKDSPIFQKLTGRIPQRLQKRVSKTTDATIIQMQDRMLSLAQIVDRIRRNNGVVSTDEDPYVKSTIITGQMDESLRDANQRFYEPIHQAIADLKISNDEVARMAAINEVADLIVDNYSDNDVAASELYLYAQHAIERNAEMRIRNARLQKRRPDQYEAGSGMTDQEASEILDFFNRPEYRFRFADLNNSNSIRSLMRALIDHTNNIRVKGGLNPDFREMVDDEGNPIPQYQDYIPLRNVIEEHADPDHLTESFSKSGGGFKVMGKEDKAATGRKTLASYTISSAVLQNQEAISRTARNEVTMSFIELMKAHPGEFDNVAEIVRENRIVPYFDSNTGTVKLRANQERMNRDILIGKKDGNEILVKIKDERLRKAMVDQPDLFRSQLGSFFKMMLGINRFLAAMRTSWSPEFLVSNGLRDIQQALVNLTEIEGQGIKRTIAKDVHKAGKGIWHARRKEDFSPEWAAAYKEFRQEGGMTAFLGIKDLDAHIKEINDRLANKENFSTPAKAKASIKALGKWIEDANIMVENAIRLSTYKHLRDHFLSQTNDPTSPKNIKRAKERAAFHARRVTVDFNAGGEQKNMMNALYLFYNASMQGTMALLAPMARSKKVRRMWATIFAAGAAADMLNRFISGEDEDGILEYDKIPDWILENNIIMMEPFGITERGYFKIPMPYLLNAVYNTGRNISRFANGGSTLGEATNSIGMTLLDTLNPLGGTNNFANFVMPTVFDPIVDLVGNEDFAGRPIYKPENPYSNADIVASQRYWNNTSPAFIGIADWLHWIGGGEGKYIPANLDIMEVSPDTLEYLFQWLGGGALSTVQRFAEFATPEFAGGKGTVYDMFLDGDEVSVNDIPFVRRAFGNVTTREDMTTYLKNTEKYERIRQTVRDVAKDRDPNAYRAVIRRYGDDYRVAIQLHKIESSRRKLSRMINKIDRSKISEDQKKERIKEIKERQEVLVNRGNNIVRQAER